MGETVKKLVIEVTKKTSDGMRFFSHRNDGVYSPQNNMDLAHTQIGSERALFIPGRTTKLTPPLWYKREA